MRIHVAQTKNSTMVFAGVFAAALFFGAGTALAAEAGDAAEGDFVFQDNCSICHSAEQGGGHKIGPNLYGVVGRTSGTADGYTYSPAMVEAGLEWTPENLATFLAGPAALVPGTKMGFPGFTNDDDEANLIAYLETLH
jgi:cytochrome c